jgi:hypothetical protein
VVAGEHDQIDHLARSYATQRFVVIRRLLADHRATALLTATRDAPRQRVTCGHRGVSWDQQNFDADHLAYQLFEVPALVTLVTGLTGMDRIDRISCWTSCYAVGEFINTHRDAAGTIHVLVCLQSPPSTDNGGVLIVEGNDIWLLPGDAVAFEATKLEHSTTPLVASAKEPDPRRVVLVGRYFLSGCQR